MGSTNKIIPGVSAVGVVSGGFVAFLLFLNHAFDTSNDKRDKGMKVVALSATFFMAAAFLAVGATCTPNVQVRGAPASLGDVEVNDMNLRVINHDVLRSSVKSYRIVDRGNRQVHLSFVAKITAPLFIAFLIFQRQFIASFMTAGIK